MSFLPPPAIRKVIAVPTQDKIDFRAACFCHKNIVDIGFVCSVCLSSRLPRYRPFVHLILTKILSLLPASPRLLDLPVCTSHKLIHKAPLIRPDRTKFPIKTLQRLNASRPARPQPAATPPARSKLSMDPISLASVQNGSTY